jgi:hypothetical protein
MTLYGAKEGSASSRDCQVVMAGRKIGEAMRSSSAAILSFAHRVAHRRSQIAVYYQSDRMEIRDGVWFRRSYKLAMMALRLMSVTQSTESRTMGYLCCCARSLAFRWEGRCRSLLDAVLASGQVTKRCAARRALVTTSVSSMLTAKSHQTRIRTPLGCSLGLFLRCLGKLPRVILLTGTSVRHQ